MQKACSHLRKELILLCFFAGAKNVFPSLWTHSSLSYSFRYAWGLFLSFGKSLSRSTNSPLLILLFKPASMWQIKWKKLSSLMPSPIAGTWTETGATGKLFKLFSICWNDGWFSTLPPGLCKACSNCDMSLTWWSCDACFKFFSF